MVRHIILWKIRPEFAENSAEVKKAAKEGLEGLVGKIDGLISLRVITEPLKSANADMMLDSEFVSEAALNAYSVNPLHVEVASTLVRPVTEGRLCMDFEV